MKSRLTVTSVRSISDHQQEQEQDYRQEERTDSLFGHRQDPEQQSMSSILRQRLQEGYRLSLEHGREHRLLSDAKRQDRHD